MHHHSDNLESLHRSIQGHFTRVEIYFQDLSFELIEESPSYTFTDFISDLGGNMGVFVGWSFLTFMEVKQFLYDEMTAPYLYRLRDKSKSASYFL